MSLIDTIKSIFGRRQSEPPQYERSSTSLLMRSEAMGFQTEEQRTAEATVSACRSLIGRTFAVLPPHVLVPRSDDERDGNDRLRGHGVEVLLNQSNPEMTGPSFRQGIIEQALDGGNGFAEIERDSMGRPAALWPIDYQRVEAVRDTDGTLLFEVDNGIGSKVALPAVDVFHLRGPGGCGVLGQSVLTHHRNTIDHSTALRSFGSNWLRNSGAPSGILKINGKISEPGMQRLQAEFKQTTAGPRNAGKVFFADADATWQSIGLTMLDAEYLAQRKFSVEEIARIYGCPPQLIGDSAKATFANFEEAFRHFMALTMLPWIARFEAEANRKLFRSFPGRRQPFIKLNVNAVVRADIEKRYRAYALGRQWGFLSVNDVRRLEDMVPIDGGDEYLVPLNMLPSGTEPPANDNDPAPANDNYGNVRQLAAIQRRSES